MLNKKETEILDYIIKSINNGISPTMREICRDLGYASTSTAYRHIKSLSDKGYIIKDNGSNRSIRLANSNAKQVPVMGTVAAGQPILAIEDISDYVTVNSHYDADELFALKLKGDSMIEIGMNSGDIIIARKSNVARNGQIVVALIDDEATVKEYYKENGHFRLQPYNQNMEPIIVDDIKILGIVVSLVRNYE